MLLYTQWGYYGQFIFLQWRMKEAAREARFAALPDAAFLRISKPEMDARGKWEEPGRECWFKAHLYDVIRSRRVGDTTWLFCMDDERETQLVRQADAVTKANQDHPDKKAGHTLSMGIGDLVCERVSWNIRPVAHPIIYHSCGRCASLPARYPEIIVPPPKG